MVKMKEPKSFCGAPETNDSVDFTQAINRHSIVSSTDV